jgi:hypothetical protein
VRKDPGDSFENYSGPCNVGGCKSVFEEDVGDDGLVRLAWA